MAVVTLGEAKAHLNITATTSDTELETFIDRAEAAVVARCGPLAPVAVTSRVRGESNILALPTTPVISLTSITPLNASALTVTDYLVSEGGNVEHVIGAWFLARWYTVTYQAGRTTLAEDLRLGILELIRHMWDTQRGGLSRPGSPMSTAMSNTMPGAAYLFPFRVEQLLAPHAQVSF